MQENWPFKTYNCILPIEAYKELIEKWNSQNKYNELQVGKSVITEGYISGKRGKGRQHITKIDDLKDWKE